MIVTDRMSCPCLLRGLSYRTRRRGHRAANFSCTAEQPSPKTGCEQWLEAEETLRAEAGEKDEKSGAAGACTFRLVR